MKKSLSLLILALSAAGLSAAHAETKASTEQPSVTHGLTDAQLSKLAGTMYWDKKTKAQLAPALKTLLGKQWSDFDKAFHTSTPLRFENGKLLGSGFFGPQASAIEFRSGGVVIAAFNNGQHCLDFGPVNPGYLCEEIER